MRAPIPVAIAALFMSFAVTAQAQDKWVVGQSAPLSGGNAKFGADIRAGANAWFAAVNAKGGVQGRPIELLSMDDKNDRALAGANTFIDWLAMQQHAWLRVGLLLAMVSGAGVVYFGVLFTLGFRPNQFKKGGTPLV